MKKLPIVFSLLVFASSSALAGDANACRRLLLSQPPDEGAADPAAYFADAEKAYRDCRGAGLTVEIRVQSLVKYATARHLRGYAQAASAAYGEAIELLERAPGGDPTMLLEVLRKATLAETDAGLRTNAIEHASRALAISREQFGVESPQSISRLVQLGLVHTTFGDYKAGESLLRSAVRAAEKTCGSPQCEALSEAYSGMYAFHAAQGHEAEARKFDELVLSAKPFPVRTSQRKE